MGRGGGPARKREKDPARGRLRGRIPRLTYFLSVVYPEIALQACQGRVSGTSFPLCPCSLNVEGQTKKKDGKKARKRKYKRKKENKNIASFHQTFAILFSSPALKRERRLRRGLIASLSSHGRAWLPGGLQGLLGEPGLKKGPGRKLGFYPAPCPSEWWLDG